MIADLKPYAEYKESGLPWLGPVPRHWDLHRLRASITDCVNGVWGADPNGKDDLICVRVADFDRVNLRVSLRKKTVRAIPLSARSRRLLRKDDLLLEKSGGGDLQPVGAVVAYDHDEPAVCSNFIARMSMASGYNNFFVNYLHFTLYAHRINLRSIKQTTGIQNLDSNSYLSELVVFPPPAEQDAIVRFLDWANGRLERAIRAKRRVIALLNEQKQAIIERAVTRGLDPSVPLKASGISWLGDIPQHWEATKLYRVTDPARKIMYGIVLPGPDVDTGVYIIKGGNCEDGRLRAECLSRTTTEIESGYARSRLRGSDIVYAIRGSIGAAQIVPDELAGANLTQDAARIAPSSGIFPLWLLFAVRSQSFFSKLEAGALGATIRGINIRDLKRADLAVPPMEEQEQIATFLLERTGRVNTAISRLEREIELLRDYRTRLVADVVTGKLDVREAAAHLPEEAPPDTAEDDAHLSLDPEAAAEEAAV